MSFKAGSRPAVLLSLWVLSWPSERSTPCDSYILAYICRLFEALTCPSPVSLVLTPFDQAWQVDMMVMCHSEVCGRDAFHRMLPASAAVYCPKCLC
jgi:hypothetical protein